jgi:4-methyl-5(b-hydroxyethyl)-thiazole monophosphate biosynthesis
MVVEIKTLIILADGFEDIEAFTVIDILRRAGIEVTLAGLVSKTVESSSMVKVMADEKLNDIRVTEYEAVILPGGRGYKALINSKAVLDMVKDFDKRGKLVAAICAAPVVLAKAGILDRRIATVYPGLEKQIPRPRDAKIVVDGNVVTSRSPGTALIFALKLVEILSGRNSAKKVRESLMIE